MFWVLFIVIFPKFQISLGLHPRCTPYQIRFFKFSDNFPTSLDSFQLIQKLFFPTTLSHYTCPFFQYQLNFPFSIDLSNISISFPTSMILSKLIENFPTSTVIFHLRHELFKIIVSNFISNLRTFNFPTSFAFQLPFPTTLIIWVHSSPFTLGKVNFYI